MNQAIAIFLFFIVFQTTSNGQSHFSDAESQLAFDCDVMVNASEPKHRIQSAERFTKGFIQLLKQPHSYTYNFDGLRWISKKEPADHSFRIFTWEVDAEKGEAQYYGVIQTSDEKLFVLTDNFKNAEGGIKEEEFSAENWLGALYYNLMEQSTSKGEKYYLLFGIHKWDKFENVKIADILFFTKEGVPYFGKSVFNSTLSGQGAELSNRLVFKYASDAQLTFNFNPGLQMIVVDNLVKKMGRIPGQGETLVPDGSYIGYELKGDYWVRTDKIAIEEPDAPPLPSVKQPIEKKKTKKSK
jgi:hypothetical protein